MKKLLMPTLLVVACGLGVLAARPIPIRAQTSTGGLKAPITYVFRVQTTAPNSVVPLVQVPPGLIIRVTGLSFLGGNYPTCCPTTKLVEASTGQARWNGGVLDEANRPVMTIPEPGVVFASGETLGFGLVSPGYAFDISITGWVESWP